MSAVDFDAWARPGLPITLGGVAYTVAPPSVRDMRLVLALAARIEVGRDRLPPAINDILEDLPTDGHPALGDTYQAMVAGGVDPVTIDRVGVYATLFWARGREYADFVAERIWGPERDAAADADPKASRSRSGRPRTGKRSGTSRSRSQRKTPAVP